MFYNSFDMGNEPEVSKDLEYYLNNNSGASVATQEEHRDWVASHDMTWWLEGLIEDGVFRVMTDEEIVANKIYLTHLIVMVKDIEAGDDDWECRVKSPYYKGDDIVAEGAIHTYIPLWDIDEDCPCWAFPAYDKQSIVIVAELDDSGYPKAGYVMSDEKC